MSKFLLLVVLIVKSTCALPQLRKTDVVFLNLPIVEISTLDGESPSCQIINAPIGCWGVTVNSDYKAARMVITKGNDTLYNSDLYGDIAVRYRGNTSAVNPDMKPYKIKLKKKADLLNRNDKKYKDKEWLLLAGSMETHMRTITGLKLNQIMGFQYSPSCEFCIVFFNDDFKGFYLLTESIKRNQKCRMDIDSTGYLAEYDSYWWNENYSYGTGPMRYTLKYPDVDSVSSNAYAIEKDLLNFENSLTEGNFDSYIDVESFDRWILEHDLLGTFDAGGSNIYLYKKDNMPLTKLEMGPLWDFDSAYMETGWAMQRVCLPQFVSLFRSNSFCASYVNYWKNNKNNIKTEIFQFLDSLEVADGNDNLRTASLMFYGVDVYQQKIDDFRSWYSEKFNWIDNNVDCISLDVCKHENGLYYDILGRNCGKRKKAVFVGDGIKRLIR